jgi:hypothetical protein
MTITGVGGGASSVAADTVNGRVSRELWKIVSSPRTVSGPVDNSATARADVSCGRRSPYGVPRTF